MVEWKTEKEGAGTEIFNLYLSHHYQERLELPVVMKL